MVINTKQKYLFVGLPYSASSTISKELIKLYDGLSVLQKHTNIPTFIRRAKIDLDDYLVFGVFRNPIEMTYTRFIKLKFNEKGVFTNPGYFKENGGHINKRTRDLRKKIVNEDWTFEDYVRFQNQKYIPYDNYFSINEKYFSYVIDFRNLNEGFGMVLNKCGLEQKRKLPEYNKTSSKKKAAPRISNELLNRYFGPFLKEHKEYINMDKDVRPSLINQLIYYSLKPVRRIKVAYNDNKRDQRKDEYFSNLNKDKILDV